MDRLEALGINISSLVFYLVNFGLLLLVLARYLYKPLLRFLEERQAVIRRNLSEAEELKRSFEEESKKLKEENKRATEQLLSELEMARKQAAAQADKIREEALAERSQLILEAHEQIERMKQELEHELEEEILDRVNKILSYALRSNLPPERVLSSLKIAWKEVQAKPRQNGK